MLFVRHLIQVRQRLSVTVRVDQIAGTACQFLLVKRPNELSASLRTFWTTEGLQNF